MKLWQIFLVIAVIVILVFLSFGFIFGKSDLKTDIGVGLAESFHDSKKYDFALSMCEWVLEDEPDNRDALAVKAKILTETGNQDEALELQRYIVYDIPEEATKEDWQNLASLTIKAGNTSEAVDAYGKLEEYYTQMYIEDPTADTLYSRGQVLIKLQRYDEAIDCYLKMTALEPNSSKSWIGLGDAYLFKSMYEQGQLKDLYADLGKDPSERVNKYNFNAYQSNMKAVEAYNKAVELDPLAYALVASKIVGSYQQSIENYQDILEGL
ncbi:tetratricopeptide repeat protein [Methanolacinia paynteri]|uniref:tetratricopeptide repeat protein n=1 Tax=Methanolacinia paynteri TaxID=230356 RepID=UPI00064EF989|nr:tetratricopeptide repeat protein [Methanolacinia paynteri]